MGISGNIKQLKGRILNIASFHQPTFKQKIRGYLICIFVSTIIIGCIPILSVYASNQTGDHFDTTEKNITQLNLSSNFGDYTGSFVLYDQSADKWNIYNMEHASTRVSRIRLIKYMMHYLAWNLELLHQNIPLSHGMENHILLIHGKPIKI